ncbi:type II toxin-antitoxin system PemK/MazF family toxin [Candidatus Berkiella aquae]|uniref:Type II toxin-antitoxin system PemK/MazF family toxin n=1 Tax=Candidatus Berkiella aquae TaxID=295108 RepID=A0A0Q9YM23_9GAMM|nr:type II toxin-antitoxin system PemK/MazF family toxin [Candidatus Berkiella aquae]MCS5710517.1 type II toxin-antitoxin system PemK/MazF family toxin [Candidatus Berkiella aquae]
MPPKMTLNRGDLIIIDFDPQAGTEITKRRPALVISPKIYNEKGSKIICCPITSTIKLSDPWLVILPKGLKIEGAVVSDQIKSMDWKVRKAKKIGIAPDEILDEVLARIVTLVT